MLRLLILAENSHRWIGESTLEIVALPASSREILMIFSLVSKYSCINNLLVSLKINWFLQEYSILLGLICINFKIHYLCWAFSCPALGVRMFYNNPDMLWRRKLEEQADFQQAIELQNRRLMSLQLLDMKRNSHHQTLSTGGIISSQTHSPSFSNQNNILSGDRSIPESKQGTNLFVSFSLDIGVSWLLKDGIKIFTCEIMLLQKMFQF